MSENGYVRGEKVPPRRHVFRLTDGDTIIVPYRDARRVLDKRGGAYTLPQTVWEVRLHTGVIRRLWPDEIQGWTIEELA